MTLSEIVDLEMKCDSYLTNTPRSWNASISLPYDVCTFYFIINFFPFCFPEKVTGSQKIKWWTIKASIIETFTEVGKI